MPLFHRYVRFTTDAPSVHFTYETQSPPGSNSAVGGTCKGLWHMPASGACYLDLYAFDTKVIDFVNHLPVLVWIVWTVLIAIWTSTRSRPTCENILLWEHGYLPGSPLLSCARHLVLGDRVRHLDIVLIGARFGRVWCGLLYFARCRAGATSGPSVRALVVTLSVDGIRPGISLVP